MKKFILALLMVFGTTALHANYNECCESNPCDCPTSCDSYGYQHQGYCDSPCDPYNPCAPVCGTSCAMNYCCMGIAAAAIIGFIVAVATNSDSAHSHN